MVILGYSIITVPTGILPADFPEQIRKERKQVSPSWKDWVQSWNLKTSKVWWM